MVSRIGDAIAIATGRLQVVRPDKTKAEGWGWRGGYHGGTGFDGSKIRGSLRAAYPGLGDLNAEALRTRSRSARWESMQARAITNRYEDSVIGTGLMLRSIPAWEVIKSPMSDDEKRALTDEIDVRFKLYWESHEPDSTGRRTGPELEGFVFRNEIIGGDLPIIFRYSGDSSRMSKLSLQVLDPDQIDTRQTTYTGGADRVGISATVSARGNILRDGLELTPAGELVAMYILDPDKPYGTPTRVPFFGPTNVWGLKSRRFAILPSILDLPGQVRGVGLLAPIVHELQKITDYEAAELEAALLNAVIAAAITAEKDTQGGTRAQKAIGAGLPGQAQAATTEPDKPLHVEKTAIIVDRLKPGEKLESYNTARPNVNFGAFLDSVAKYLAPAVSQPVEVMTEAFNKNYTAAKAAIEFWWETVLRWRMHFVSQFSSFVFEAWLSEEVEAGRFPVLRANGFRDDPIRRAAWLQAEYIGDTKPSVDPLKDAEADDLRLAQCFTTGERGALEYNRSDWWDNVKRRIRELAAMPKAPTLVKQPKQNTPASDDPEDEDPAQGGAN